MRTENDIRKQYGISGEKEYSLAKYLELSEDKSLNDYCQSANCENCDFFEKCSMSFENMEIVKDIVANSINIMVEVFDDDDPAGGEPPADPLLYGCG